MRKKLLSILSCIAIFFILLYVLIMYGCVTNPKIIDNYEMTNREIVSTVKFAKQMCKDGQLSSETCEIIKNAYTEYQQCDSNVNDAWISILQEDGQYDNNQLQELRLERDKTLSALIKILSVVISKGDNR